MPEVEKQLTLVVSCISPNHIVQVSDRRLTWITGADAGRVADDNSNKAVVVCGCLVLAYTGVAQIRGLKTDEWALRVASEVTPYNPQRVCEALAFRATEDFRNIRLSKSDRRHAFLISGWAKLNDPNAPLTPFVSAISNALNNEWHWLPEAENAFQIRTVPLAQRPYLIAAVGQPLQASALNRLRRGVRKYVRRERGAEAYIQMVAAAIRETAVDNDLVGENLMAISLPLNALESGGGIAIPLTFPIQSGPAVAIYLPISQGESIRYAPNYTCNGMSLSRISIRPG